MHIELFQPRGDTTTCLTWFENGNINRQRVAGWLTRVNFYQSTIEKYEISFTSRWVRLLFIHKNAFQFRIGHFVKILLFFCDSKWIFYFIYVKSFRVVLLNNRHVRPNTILDWAGLLQYPTTHDQEIKIQLNHSISDGGGNPPRTAATESSLYLPFYFE